MPKFENCIFRFRFPVRFIVLYAHTLLIPFIRLSPFGQMDLEPTYIHCTNQINSSAPARTIYMYVCILLFASKNSHPIRYTYSSMNVERERETHVCVICGYVNVLNSSNRFCVLESVVLIEWAKIGMPQKVKRFFIPFYIYSMFERNWSSTF